ncbi:Cysteine-rich secretory protein family protein [Enhygromyxa salina]|uniref:Cysteine-rich secretory protein family protein n=2 Tax=Enhygromyxa salina TaxID=215803 RepID=A0A2S9YU35_9BACT|nr:Cysteine-rich secretory protein family protein [Enhygromyxa salina]
MGAMASSACYSGIDPDTWYLDGGFGDTLGETDGSEAADSAQGDGDGDPSSTTGDGDGDGDPTTGDPTTGDGDGDPDPTTGDGDPDPTTGDGDGDGDGDPTTGGPSTGDGDGDGEGDPLPNNPYCNPVSDWAQSWVDKELEVIELVNMARAQGGNCGSEGDFAPSGPLTWEAALTCAARVHSKDMADNNYFSHTNQQGNGPGWRLGQAGYDGGGWGENIAAGYPSPSDVVQGWLDSDGHCANMLNGSFTLIGVGYASGNGQYGSYWTQNFGK